MFGHFKYTFKQNKIIKDCISKHSQEYDKWFFHNLWYPVGIVILSFVLVFISKGDIDKALPTLLSGSISLLGINVLFAMSSYLIRLKIYKSDDLRSDVVNLSGKLNDWKTALIVIGTILFVLPSLYEPSGIGKLIFFVISVVILIISINVSGKIFMIRDDFYKKTYDLEETFDAKIRNESNETHGDGW